MIPIGLCQCGCGRKTNIVGHTCRDRGVIKGQPRRYIWGHSGGAPEKKTNRYKVSKSTGCWIWQLALNRQGYGIERGEFSTAYKNAYVRKYGPVPEGMEIHHRCEVKRCVNPDHMEAILKAEHIRITSGKINWEIAGKIRRLRKTGKTCQQLADMFGLSRSAVSHVVNGYTWVRSGT